VGDFTMPSLGADMEAGTVSQWLVKPGDEVQRGDVIAVVETEKSTIEVEIFESGTIDELLVHEGERVPVGAVLAHVISRAPRAVATTTSPSSVTNAVPPAAAITDTDRVTVATTVTTPTPATPHPAVLSPVVRHLAERLGVDLVTLPGSGPGGAVTRHDVEQAARRTDDEARVRTRAAERKPKSKRKVAAPPQPVHRVASSPLARRRAAELGVDLSALRGTGPHGSVIERDVQRARAPAPVEQAIPAEAEDRQAAMRRAIGALMARSKREIPHYYLSTTIDLTAAMAWLTQANVERPVTARLVLPVLLLKATACAVERVPEMNGFLIDGTFHPSEAVHIGVAVSLRTGGVIAPAIHNTARLSLDEMMTALRDLVGRARTGILRSSEMSDPTITVTNLGELGVEAVFGVIYPPQVALVGFGRVTEQPWAHDGMLGVRQCVTATLSADHRVSDGHRGARFLAEIDRLLQEPEKL